MTQPHQRNRHPKYRKKYKVHNWRSYEQSLINRGDLTLWLSEDVIQSWSSDLDQRIGRPKLYSDLAFETALALRLLFKLPLKQTEGFLMSIFRLMNSLKPVAIYRYMTTILPSITLLNFQNKQLVYEQGRSSSSTTY